VATTLPPPERRVTHDSDDRRRLIALACVVAVLALLHFVDHVVRGQIVVSSALDPLWNHSGWPFNTHGDKPYIFPASLVVVSTIVLGGIFLTARGKLWAGYWLAASIFLIAILVFVHFVGLEPGSAETPGIIRRTYGNDVRGILAMVDLFGLFAVLATLAVTAIRIRQRSGRW